MGALEQGVLAYVLCAARAQRATVRIATPALRSLLLRPLRALEHLKYALRGPWRRGNTQLAGPLTPCSNQRSGACSCWDGGGQGHPATEAMLSAEVRLPMLRYTLFPMDAVWQVNLLCCHSCGSTCAAGLPAVTQGFLPVQPLGAR